MDKQFFFLAGLPRTGSTLLANILLQNSDVHAEGSSVLCNLTWSVSQECECNSTADTLIASRRFPDTVEEVMSSLPSTYYRAQHKRYIFDKNRKWCSLENMRVVRRYLNPDPKVVVLVREVDEVVKSFMRIDNENDAGRDPYDTYLSRENNPMIIESVLSVRDALRDEKKESYLFIPYDKLVNNPDEQVKRIYEFCGIPAFAHQFDDVADNNLEEDRVHGLRGLHSIRSVVSKRQVAIALDERSQKKCDELSDLIREAL